MTQGKPKVRPDDIEAVKNALKWGFWMKGRVIRQHYGITTRKVRAVAEATGDIISSQAGYKLASAATEEELRIAIADLESRARHMLDRAAKHQYYLDLKIDDDARQGGLF